jgi:RNA polymerase sigma-70 factor (ECF subfamily)
MVEAARRGDRAAWGFLYRRYARVVHGVLLSRVGPGDAEDLVHDVFATAMRSITGVRENGCIGAWLAAVARNRATDFLRSRRRRRAFELGNAVDPRRVRPIGDDSALEAGDVLAAIRGLPETYRETLTLRLVEGLTGPEIADRLGMTHGSVRVNLCRGMAMLREALGREGAP